MMVVTPLAIEEIEGYWRRQPSEEGGSILGTEEDEGVGSFIGFRVRKSGGKAR